MKHWKIIKLNPMVEQFNVGFEVHTEKTAASELHEKILKELATDEKKGLILASLELIRKRQTA